MFILDLQCGIRMFGSKLPISLCQDHSGKVLMPCLTVLLDMKIDTICQLEIYQLPFGFLLFLCQTLP